MTQQDYTTTKTASEVLRAVNNKTRREIINLLDKKGELCVGDIYAELKMEQATTSSHLAILRKHDIISARKGNRNVIYKLNQQRVTEIVGACKQLSA